MTVPAIQRADVLAEVLRQIAHAARPITGFDLLVSVQKVFDVGCLPLKDHFLSSLYLLMKVGLITGIDIDQRVGPPKRGMPAHWFEASTLFVQAPELIVMLSESDGGVDTDPVQRSTELF